MAPCHFFPNSSRPAPTHCGSFYANMVKILSFRVLDPEKQKVVAPPQEPLYFRACEHFYLLYTKSGSFDLSRSCRGRPPCSIIASIDAGKVQVLSYSDTEAVLIAEFKPQSVVHEIKYLPINESYVISRYMHSRSFFPLTHGRKLQNHYHRIGR